MPGTRRLPRRRRSQTRELLLLAGALVADETVARTDDALLGDWLSHIRFDEVLEVAAQLQLYLEQRSEPLGTDLSDATAARAWRVRARRDEVLAVDTSGHRPIAKSTAYTAFDNERDFREQLARTLLRSQRVRDASLMSDVHAELAARPGGPPPIGVTFGELVTAELARIRSFAAPTVEVGSITFAGHPLIHELLARLVEGAADVEVASSVAAVYQGVLDAYGWRMQEGLRVEDLTTALRALLLGYLFFGRVWPDGVRDEVAWEDAGPRSAVSLAVEGVVRRFAEPIAPSAGEEEPVAAAGPGGGGDRG
jgi:hypothetical protein